MDIYELLQEIIVVKKYRISPNEFSEIEKNKLESEADKKIFDLLKNVSSLGAKITTKSISYHPFMVLEGKRTFSLEDMSEDDYDILKALKFEALPLNLRARVTDLLWTQKKDYRVALVAAQSYLELFMLWYSEEEWIGTLDMIKRAICISAQIGNTKIYEKACNIIYKEVLRLSGEDDGFLSLRLLDILLEQGYGNMEQLLTVADEIIEKHSKDVTKVEQAYEIKALCLNKLKRKTKVKETNIALAEYFIEFAESIIGENLQGAMRAETFFQKAISILRNNGEPNRAEQVVRRLVEVQKEIPKQMVTITTEFDVTGINRNIDLNMEGLTFEESIIRLTQMITFPTKKEIKEKLFREYSEHPLAHFFGKNLVNSTGQTLFALKPLNFENPEEDEMLLNMHLHQKMLEEQKTIGDIWLKYTFRYLNKKFPFTMEDLDFLINENPIIPEGRERIFRSAIYMALKGQYYEALHILAPQVENLFRNIAREVGGLTITLENDGSSKEKVLSSIFDLPELLDCYDNDILFVFAGLLNEQAGANIRNEVAHGILGEGMASSGVCLYFIGAVIKLLSFTSLSCYEIYKKNTKLHSFIEPEEDALKIITSTKQETP